MRLNKEPPDDYPVVEFVAVGATSTSAAVSPRVVRGGGDAGAGGSARTAPLTADVDGHEDDEDLRKIKNSGALTEDDNCVVCLSGEIAWTGQGRARGGGRGGMRSGMRNACYDTSKHVRS